MTYVVSNLHGDFVGFQELLKKIGFGKKDTLFILGDTVDFGDGSMDLLVDISMRENVFSLAGEHDFKAARMLSGFQKMLDGGGTPDKEFAMEMAEWCENGGQETLDGFRALDDDMREGVLDYLADSMLYDTVKVGDTRYLLVHAGLGNFSSDKSLDDYTPEEVFTPELPDAAFLKKYILVVGHTPTKDGKINRRDGVIYMDCGVADGGSIGCLCLETGEEYYV